ncbi:RidA family protein [Alkalihalobacillus oceani]|uniref:RidA family protein n=1 Tax=Halalkalibacter oceani TaxID=1653776 RepID=A0A9X2IN27_9BACI|nr:RidA family protein [Halalkalibacter oceani]MCM3712987.1 RidA family protein [Halalkalibacter oceani]
MNFEQRLADLNIELPVVLDKHLPFSSGVIVDNLVYLSGQTCLMEGGMKYTGVVGSSVTIQQAEEAAEICILNLLGALKEMIGDLNKVKKVVKVNGYVASEKTFTDQPQVINAATNLLNKIFGEDNQHARAAIGVASLPMGTPVEIEMIVELRK